jgi:predicted nucleotidyltransferase
MIKKAEILNKLRISKTELHKFGVIRIGLFGSVRRDEINPGSDVDILIDFNPEQETYENYMETCTFLESLFAGSKLDIVTAKGLSPFIGPYILNDVEYA